MNWTAGIGLVGTLAGVVLSIIFYLRSRRFKRLTLTFTQGKLLSKTHPQVQILFAGNAVENLWRLRAVCWDSGTQEVRWSDIPSGREPQLVFENARILSIAHAGGSDSAEFTETNDHRSVSMKFAYLNPNDCGFFEVLYENVGPQRPSFEFVAPVVGGKLADSRTYSGPLTVVNHFALPGFLLIWLLGVCISIDPVLQSVKLTKTGIDVYLPGAGLFLFLLAVFAGLVGLTRLYLRAVRDAHVPESAKKFLTGAA